MHPFIRHIKFWPIALGLILVLTPLLSTVSTASAEQTKEEKARQKMLNLEAANALWRLKRALEKEGFYSGRSRLNVWRAAAMDAGKFDPQKYEEFRQQLYEKSVADSLKCFDHYIKQKNAQDAKMCLQTWKMHAKEIEVFDEPTYQKFIKRLNEMMEEKKAEESTE